MGVWGHTERSLPHTAAVTPESLRSCLGRGVVGTPRGGFWAHGEVPPPHTAAVTPESLRSCLGRGGIGAPRGGSLGAGWGTGTPVGPEGVCHPTPRRGGSTRVFPAPPGPPGAGAFYGTRAKESVRRLLVSSATMLGGEMGCPGGSCLFPGSRTGEGRHRWIHSQPAFGPAALHRGGRGAGC